MMNDSPWVKRLKSLEDERIIARKTLVRPEPVRGLAMMAPDLGAALIEATLCQLFLPTRNVVKILIALLHRSLAYSMRMYPSEDAHLRLVYADSTKPSKTAGFPTCLTGPAGVGKSELLKAFVRMMPEDRVVKGAHGHPAFLMRACWYVPVATEVGIIRSLLPLAMSDAEKAALSSKGETQKLAPQGKSLLKIQEDCRHNSRVLGISFIILDELQFLTRSEKAVVATSKFLQAYSEIDPSMVYAANYSLCHKLMGTAQETRQRFLSDPLILLPDDPDSVDWANYLKECDIALGGILDAEVIQNKRIIYNYTFGLKRLVMLITKEAYRISRNRSGKKITLDDFEAAYLSAAYSANLTDVTVMRQQTLSGRCIRKDLWCPFPVPPGEMERIQQHFDLESRRQVANQVAQSALTKPEREALGEHKQARRGQKAEPSKPRKKAASVEELMDSFDEYQKMLNRSA